MMVAASLLALAPVPAGAVGIPTPLSAACAVPDPLLGLPLELRTTGQRLAEGKVVTVLAIGSSSTQGVGASSPDAAYPARLKAELTRRFGQSSFEVLNRGIGGEVAVQTADRLRSEVVDARPDIVIWQVGTNDALRDIEPEAFHVLLDRELEWLSERGVDVILMDPQYFPRIAEQDRYRRFVDDVANAATRGGVGVMRRFEAMRHWASAPAESRANMLAADDFHLNDQGYACVAEVLAEAIARRLNAR